MPNAENQPHAEQFLVHHAARETSLSWMASKAAEFASYYRRRVEAVASGEPEKILSAEQQLDDRRLELIQAIGQELKRVSQLGGDPAELLASAGALAHAEEEEPDEPPPAAPAAAAPRKKPFATKASRKS